MSKISSAYNSILHGSTALEAPSSKTLRGKQGTIVTPNHPISDRITLSEAGLAAAARYSHLIPRPANTYTPALPAPQTDTKTAALSIPDSTGETPSSRNMVRTMYAQQQELASDQGSPLTTRLDIHI